MDSALEAVYARLKEFRTREDLTLAPTKYLKETYTGFDGEEHPLKLRYYQVQGVLHLFAMNRFLLGDDCGLGKCVTGDTLVLTDQGWEKIQTLSDGPLPTPGTFGPAKPRKVWTGYKWAPLKSFYRDGRRKTIRIQTRYGFAIEGSYRHPVWARLSGGGCGWKRLPEIQIGDLLCIDRKVLPADLEEEHDEGGPWFFDPVVRITEGEAEVMDLEVDDPDHSFVGNGFVNHNTIQTIAGLCYVWGKDPNRKAIILTNKSAVAQWAKEFRKFCHTDPMTILVASGTPAKRTKVYKEFEEATGPTVLLLGYASARQDIRHMQHWSDYVLIMDEATAFKNPKTQTSKVCAHLAQMAAGQDPDTGEFRKGRVWALTATLIKNNLMEGYGIYSVVVPGLFPPSLNQFISRYCVTRMQKVAKGRQVPIVVGYRPWAIDEFRKLIDPYYIGRPKHEVAKELPPLTIKTENVGLTRSQQAKYNEALAGLLEIDKTGEEKEVSKLTALIYCQQIVDHPELIDCEGDSEKMDRLLEMVTEGDFAEENVIIYTRFKKMVDFAMPILQKKGIPCARITGDEDGDERQAAMDAFQSSNEETRVVFITDAGSEAINLQSAKAMIFYDSPWSAGNYLQLLGRMVRIGSAHDRVYAVHLCAKGTIDEKVMGVLKKKMKIIEAVMGKRIKGEDDEDVEVFSDNDISDLFQALREDALRAGK